MTLSTSLVFVVSCISRVIQYCKLCTQPCVVPNQYEFQKKIFKKYHHQSQYGSVLFWTPLSFIVWTKTVGTFFKWSSLCSTEEKSHL